jgi:UDPglucose 6-dehydrogenase
VTRDLIGTYIGAVGLAAALEMDRKDVVAAAGGAAAHEPGTLAVVGCGRLGLTMALAFAAKGFTVHGVDVSPSVVRGISDRTFSSDEPGVSEALHDIPPDDPRLQATTDLSAAAAAADTMLICVDTPSTGGDRHYDHSKVGAVLSALNSYAREQKAEGGSSDSRIPRHVVVCCTVMPGYMLEVGVHLLRDSSQLRAGLLYNPLFIAQGEIMRGLLRPDLILIGEAGDCVGHSSGGHALAQIWNRVCDGPPALADSSGARASSSASKDLPIRRMSWTSAEITKLSLNCFVTMKIAFAVRDTHRLLTSPSCFLRLVFPPS